MSVWRENERRGRENDRLKEDDGKQPNGMEGAESVGWGGRGRNEIRSTLEAWRRGVRGHHTTPSPREMRPVALGLRFGARLDLALTHLRDPARRFPRTTQNLTQMPRC